MVWYEIVSSSQIVQAELALGRGDLREALALALLEQQAGRRSDRGLLVAASACRAARELAGAQSFYEQVSPDSPRLYGQAQRELGRLALDAGRPNEAEKRLRQSLQIVPDDSAALDHLIYLLTLEGRAWEARRLVTDRLRAGVVTPNYLKIASTPHPNLENAADYAARCLSTVPKDSLPRLMLAHQAWRDDQPEIARTHLELVLQQYPDLIEAHALWGRVIAETGTTQEFLQACQRLPPQAEDHPEIWLARGIWAMNQGQTEAAVRCCWEALQREPSLPQAHYRLSQALVAAGKAEEAQPFAERSQQLTMLSLEMQLLADETDPQKLSASVSQLEQLGRDWEAAAWCELLLLEKGVQPEWARVTQRRLSRRLWSCATLTSPAKDLSRQIDLSRFPLPVLQEMDGGQPPSSSAEQSSQITFTEDAERTGLKFTYDNGSPGGTLESMLEMDGGGAAILDYDGNGRPDVFFTQGGALPPAPFDPGRTDRLFRNLRDDDASADEHTYQDVSVSAGLADGGYGQGVTSGDFDNDGFPDLYVGNIGPNQFYQNNGDGTFTEIAGRSGTQAGGWTSSCVLADFNQDGLPDLYVVTYLGGEQPFHLCDKRARPRCSPLNFSAEPDRFYLNLGDGRFQDLTGTSGLEAPEGRGLGVIAADFDGSRRLSLFVANDMTANFYFLNRTIAADNLQFTEQALLSGLAFDYQGQAKACMGVAADDFNHDERLDLFVTNFYRQSNDLFLQQEDGTFRDYTREARLHEPSFLKLGWGTQSLDADLDGWPDLIVTNGHVHDPLDPQIPYAMPPQVFRNQQNHTFAEISALQLGAFFQRPSHGRSMARLDWNRDGREDVCISHQNQPAALVTNRTEPAGHFLAFRLVAVNSARDAIGATVRVTAGEQSWLRQLTAGDGFQASNERRLVFGLGDIEAVETVEIAWPSGQREQFSHLELDQDWLLIEHRQPVLMR